VGGSGFVRDPTGGLYRPGGAEDIKGEGNGISVNCGPPAIDALKVGSPVL